MYPTLEKKRTIEAGLCEMCNADTQKTKTGYIRKNAHTYVVRGPHTEMRMCVYCIKFLLAQGKHFLSEGEWDE